jgi:hypothetical protein
MTDATYTTTLRWISLVSYLGALIAAFTALWQLWK